MNCNRTGALSAFIVPLLPRPQEQRETGLGKLFWQHASSGGDAKFGELG
jgi:hypothetical protein